MKRLFYSHNITLSEYAHTQLAYQLAHLLRWTECKNRVNLKLYTRYHLPTRCICKPLFATAPPSSIAVLYMAVTSALCLVCKDYMDFRDASTIDTYTSFGYPFHHAHKHIVLSINRSRRLRLPLIFVLSLISASTHA